MTLDGVFDADAMDHWWHPYDSTERVQYIVEEYSKGDVYLLGQTTYEMLWPGWSTQTTGDGPGPILNRMKKYVVSTPCRYAGDPLFPCPVKCAGVVLYCAMIFA